MNLNIHKLRLDLDKLLNRLIIITGVLAAITYLISFLEKLDKRIRF